MKRLLLVPLFALLVSSPVGAILYCGDCNCFTTACTAPCGGFGGGVVSCGGTGYCVGSINCSSGGGCLTFEDVESALFPEGGPVSTQALRPGFAASRLNARLSQYVDSAGLGAVYSGPTGFRVAKGAKLQAPDLAFVASGRTGVPDLVARILPAAGFAQAAGKDAASWLAAGVQAALVIDTDHETVTVYARGSKPWTLGVADLLELPSIIPGWSLRVADLFQ